MIKDMGHPLDATVRRHLSMNEVTFANFAAADNNIAVASELMDAGIVGGVNEEGSGKHTNAVSDNSANPKAWTTV